MPTFYIPLGAGFVPATAGTIQSGAFVTPTNITIAVPQADAPNILQRWTLLSIYAPYAISVTPAAAGTVNFQLAISALINETPVWAQQANGQLFGAGPLTTSQVLAGDLFNPLDLNAGQKVTFSYQVMFDANLTSGTIYIGGRVDFSGNIQAAPGVVNYDVAYDPALPGRGT